MNKKIIYAFIAMACVGIPTQAVAQKFALKPHVDIGVGSAMSMRSDLPLTTKSASNVSFGVDFGYTFWQMMANRLEVNVGLGYSATGVKLGMEGLSYSYNAPASADEDGNAYVRYYELSPMKQKVNLGYFNIPIYLTYGYQFNNRVGVHADLGFRLGFKTGAKLNSVTGTSNSYGVYPEYDNLVIDQDWINCFGTRNLADAKKAPVAAGGVNASLLVGAACDVNVYGPLWFNVGLRYNCGFTNSFKHLYHGKTFTAESTPVGFTVADGQTVKPLTGYLKSSKLSPFAIHVGFDIRF